LRRRRRRRGRARRARTAAADAPRAFVTNLRQACYIAGQVGLHTADEEVVDPSSAPLCGGGNTRACAGDLRLVPAAGPGDFGRAAAKCSAAAAAADAHAAAGRGVPAPAAGAVGAGAAAEVCSQAGGPAAPVAPDTERIGNWVASGRLAIIQVVHPRRHVGGHVRVGKKA